MPDCKRVCISHDSQLGIFNACMPEELTMKKDVVTSAAEAVAPKKPEFPLIDENLLKSRMYFVLSAKARS